MFKDDPQGQTHSGHIQIKVLKGQEAQKHYDYEFGYGCLPDEIGLFKQDGNKLDINRTEMHSAWTISDLPNGRITKEKNT